MKKQSLILLFFLITLVAAILAVSKQEMDSLTAMAVVETEEDESADIFFLPEYETVPPWQERTYIIEFEGEPLLQRGSLRLSEIEAQHEQAEQEISQILSSFSEPDGPGKILFEYRQVFNGIAVNASLYGLSEIGKLPYVKGIFPSVDYHIDLNVSVPLIRANETWQLTDGNGNNVTGENITIAIVDTGVDYTHPDFGGCTNASFLGGSCPKVVGGYDFYNGDSNPIDDNGHGTHVAATAAGNGALKGVAPGAKILAYKVCSSQGSCPTVNIIAAIDAAVANGTDIISMSLGGVGTPDSSTALAVDNAVNAGVVATISAGNDGPSEGTVGSPGTSRKAITVGASTKTDGIASFSSRGPTAIGTLKPDVVAPGYNICAARASDGRYTNTCYDSQHVLLSGTSMAAPHVAGMAALLLQAHNDWSPMDVKMAMRNTAKSINLSLTTQGHGRVDAFAAANLSSRPCTAEFYTYNISYVEGGTITLNGTANCTNFKNYSVFYGYSPMTSDGSITQLLNSTGSYADTVSFSFSGNEVRQTGLSIPKNSNVTFARMTAQGFDEGTTRPYRVRVDFGSDGDVDWLSYKDEISQTEIGGGGYFYPIYGNRTLAQSFNWSGGEIGAISLMVQRRLSGNGLLIELRNDTGDSPSEQLKNISVAYEDVSTILDWNTFGMEHPLPAGKYWLVVKLAEREYGDYAMPYSAPGVDPYPYGKLKVSADYGQSWDSYFAYSDFAFKIHKFDYFDGPEIINRTIDSEINEFLKSCVSDSSGNCTFPITVNSTNGTINISEILIEYEGVASSDPTIWVQICNSSAPVFNSKLCDWDTLGIQQKRYPLLLVVSGENSTSRDYLFKQVRHYDINLPENGCLTKNGTNISISSVGQFVFENYTIEYRGVNESSWQLIKYSEEPVGNGTLGYFNSTGLASGDYVIRITSYINGSSAPNVGNVTVKVDKLLQDGWPQELDFSPFASPKVADVDNDGDLEIIAVTSRSPYILQSGGDYTYEPRSIYVFNHDGSIMEGWPQQTHSFVWGKSVTIGDLDNDGDMEIIHLNNQWNKVIARHHNGSVVEGFPIPNSADNIYAYPTLYDLDKDGNLDIVFADRYRLFAYHGNGTLMWQTPYRMVEDASYISYPVIGDVDRDGYGEILVYAKRNASLYLFNHSGELENGWPYKIVPSDNYVLDAIMADLDGDMALEIIFYQLGNGLMAVYGNGSNVTGWPAAKEDSWLTELVAADLDKDKDLEIIGIPFAYGGNSNDQGTLYVFNSDGSDYGAFPAALPLYYIYFRPTVADIDGDSEYEIIAGSQNFVFLSDGSYSEGRIASFDSETAQPELSLLTAVGAPFFRYSRSQDSAPIAVDIDGDGDVELIALSAYYTQRKPEGAFSGGRLIVWDLNAPYNASLVEWPQYRNNIYNTGSYIDVDFDNVDFNDNCPYRHNPSQEDADNDTFGDACDSVWGNVSDVNSTLPNITVSIGNSTNLSGQFSGTLAVNFYDNGTVFMNFTANFSSFSLNLLNVSVEKGVNGTRAYLIIKNLNLSGTKTIFLNRTNESSNAVCFLDSETASLAELVGSCTNLSCPGTSGSYSCTVSGSVFSISGLSHSAVIETFYEEPLPPQPPGGNGGTGSTGRTGGGILVPPAVSEAKGGAEAELRDVEVIPADSGGNAVEEAPVVEEPGEIEAPAGQRSFWQYLIMLSVLSAVAAIIIYEIRKKKQGNTNS